MKKKLYERRIGKEFKGSKSWKVSPKEDLAIKILGGLFALHGLAAIALMATRSRYGIIFFVLAFVWMFILMGYMFYLVYKKNKEDPMDIHYYDVDTKYDAIRGIDEDNTKEISKEEFFNKDQNR